MRDAEELPWTIGNGKNTFLRFHCSALADPPVEPPAAVYHMTYKFVQAETKLVSAILRNHGLREVLVVSMSSYTNSGKNHLSEMGVWPDNAENTIEMYGMGDDEVDFVAMFSPQATVL